MFSGFLWGLGWFRHVQTFARRSVRWGSLRIKAACQHWAGSRICLRASGSRQADVEIPKVHGTDSASGISQRISTFRTSTSKPKKMYGTVDMPDDMQPNVNGQGA